MGTRKAKPASASSCRSPNSTRDVGAGVKVFVGAGVDVAVGVCVGFGVRVIVGVLVGAAKRGVEQPAKPRIVTIMKEKLMTLFKTRPLRWRAIKGLYLWRKDACAARDLHGQIMQVRKTSISGTGCMLIIDNGFDLSLEGRNVSSEA